MARKKVPNNQKDLFNIQEQLTTAACVPAIRKQLKHGVLINTKG